MGLVVPILGATIEDGLIGHWSATLDPVQSGSTITDLTASGGDVSLTGGWQWVDDAQGTGTKAISAGNSSDLASFALALPATQPFTVSSWIKPSGPNMVVMSRQPSQLNYKIWTGEGALWPRFDVRTGGTTKSVFTGPVTADVWYHFVTVWDGTQIYLYLDDVKESPVAAASPLDNATGGHDYGSSSASGSEAFLGNLDTIRFYDRALSDAEVTELFDAGRGEAFPSTAAESYNELFGYGSHSPDADIKANWEMQDDPTGGTQTDRSGNGADVTITGTGAAYAGPTLYQPTSLEWNGIDTTGFAQNDAVVTGTQWTAALWVNRGQASCRLIDAQGGRSIIEITDGSLEAYDDSFKQSSIFLTTDEWKHVAVVADSGNFRFYDTGALTDTKPASPNDFGEALGIGNHYNQTANRSLVRMAGVSIFDRAFVDSEVAEAAGGPEPYFSAQPSAPTGTPQVAKPLVANPDTIVDPNNGVVTYQYQWRVADDAAGTGAADIIGANSPVYAPAAAQEGKYFAVRMTPANDGGSDPAETATESAYTATPAAAADAIDVGLIGKWSPTLDTTAAGAGTTLYDLLGINEGSIIAGTWFDDVDPTHGGTKALEWNGGSSGRVSMGQVFDAPAAYTLSIWYKWDGGSNDGLMGKWGSSSGYMLYTNFSTEELSANNDLVAVRGVPPVLGDWEHAVATYDGVTLTLYHNGVFADSAASSAPSTNTVEFALAAYEDQQTWDGRIDTARLYDRALTPAEVQQLFDAGRGEDFAPVGPTPPVNQDPPIISGNPIVDETATLTTPGVWS